MASLDTWLVLDDMLHLAALVCSLLVLAALIVAMVYMVRPRRPDVPPFPQSRSAPLGYWSQQYDRRIVPLVCKREEALHKVEQEGETV